MAYTKYSLTPANNTSAPPDGAPEGMLPSAVNDTMRDMMAQIRDCGDGVRDGTYTMTAPKITGGTITGVTLTGNTFSSPIISGGTINNATIGATTATTGKFTSVTNTGLTSGRVMYATTGGLVTDSANLTFDGTTLSTIGITTTGNTILGNASSDTLNVANGDLIKDASGNLGLGVTPSSYDSVFKALDVGQAGNGISGNSGTTQITQGVYYNSGYKYSVTASAVGRYEINTGVHKWNIAASGTAGNAVTFTQAMTLDASGNLEVGTTTANSGIKLFPSFSSSGSSGININHVSTAASGEYYVTFQYNANVIGIISQNGTTAVTYATTSDYRLKENITPMTGALAKVAQLKPVTYKWKSDGSNGQGFIAHELQAVVPDCVTGIKDATKEEEYEITQAVKDDTGKIITPAQMGTRTVPVYQGVDTSFLVATLTKAIQEQQALIESLTTRLTALENK